LEAVRKVQRAGKVCVLDIDVQGVMSVKKAAARGLVHDLRPLFVFIAPPSLEVLEKRLRGRETEKEEDVVRRLGNARKEVEYGWVEGNFDKIVVNGELDDAYRDLVGYIERMYYSEEDEEEEGEDAGDGKKKK
jgi:guanylate kinase